jgi:small subunit ribosomal protein S4e
MHLKRQKIPSNWPIERKGTKYIVRPSSNIEKSIPILVLLRDVLKIATTRKEVKHSLNLKKILVNGKLARDEKKGLALFDTLSLIPMKKSYRVELSGNGKFDLKEITDKEAGKKVSKILNKKILKGKKVQLNLSDGRNFLSDIKCNVNDSVLIDFVSKKIESCIPLNEKSNVFVFAGKHAGKRGTIGKIKQEGKMAEIKVEKETFNVLTKQIMAIQ